MSDRVPQGQLVIMAQMTNPPTPIGFDVVVGGVTVAVVTYVQLQAAAAKYDEMERKRK